MRNDVCSKCGMSDRYVKGNFSYCRPCHTAAQSRYLARKKTGESLEKAKGKKPKSLTDSLSLRSGNLKTHCPQGHPYDKENTKIAPKPNGHARKCRACDRNYRRKVYNLPPEPLPVKLTDML